MNEIRKSLTGENEVTLSQGEAARLREYIEGLESDNTYAKAYREELTQRLKTALREKGVALDYVVENCILSKLSVDEAQALLKVLGRREKKAISQLGTESSDGLIGNTEFRI